MKNLMKAEFYYLLKNIRFYVFLAIIFVGNLVAQLAKIDKITPIISVLAFIFVAIIILEFSHKDFNQKTMKNYVGSGLSLFKVYFGKMIVCLCAVFAILLALNLASAIGNFQGFSTQEAIIGIVFSLLKAIVVFAICSLIPSGVISIIVSIVYLAGLPILLTVVDMGVMNGLSNFLLDTLKMCILQPEKATIAASEIWWHLSITVAIIAGLAFAGAVVYSKREVK